MIKVSKEDLYVAIAQEYGYTFDEIADMNPYRQYVLYRGPRIKKMTAEEYDAYSRKR